MNTASTPKSTGPDIAGQIAYAMRSMGVSPIPRNYSLFTKPISARTRR